MPASIPGDKILVTGANGHIAAWTIKILLDQGYSVRGTVRSLSRAEPLRKYLSSYGDKLEFVIVDDITKEGTFDSAIEGVDAIIHTASPLVASEESSLDYYITPAVNGTSSVLHSAIKYGNVKRIVIASSIVAIVNPIEHNSNVDETDWNEDSVNIVNEKGDSADSFIKYMASKTLAEKAAWKIYNDHKPEVEWDLVALNIPLVLGAPLLKAPSASDLNAFLLLWYNMVLDPNPKSYEDLNVSHCWADVRDVSEALIRSLWKENAGNERIAICAGRETYQEWINLIHSEFIPAPALSCPLPKAMPVQEKSSLMQVNTSKEARILGLDYKTMRETADSTINFLVSCGL